MDYNLLVIGGGPGGYVAALRAAQLGLTVALVEKGEVGGTCLNWGCIPTKALVAGVDLLAAAREAVALGIHIPEVHADFGAMMAHKATTVQLLVKGITALLQKSKVTLLRGTASFTGPNQVRVVEENGTVTEPTADHFIVATGSVPTLVPAFHFDGKTVITSDQALDLKEVPARLTIVGGGVVGCEFAGIFHELGSEVTVIELMPSLLPGMDLELSKQLGSYFKRRNIKVLVKTSVQEVQAGESGARVVIEGGSVDADKVLISIGRRPNTAGLDIDKAGVEVNQRGRIVVNDAMRTSVPHIFAIGDVNDFPVDLAHVASAQGLIAAANAAGGDDHFDGTAIPGCVFTRPEIASVGLTSEAAAEKGIAVKTSKFLFRVLGKAQAMNEIDGFVKLISEEGSGTLLGGHIIGPHASDLIAEVALAVRWGITADQLARTIHAHPTLPEAILEAAEGLQGHAIHG